MKQRLQRLWCRLVGHDDEVTTEPVGNQQTKYFYRCKCCGREIVTMICPEQFLM
ncbi:hypothetical protein [Streptococcus hyovaginalis]